MDKPVERDQIDINGVEHQLQRHQDGNGITPGQNSVDTDRKQNGGQGQKVRQCHISFPPGGQSQ